MTSATAALPCRRRVDPEVVRGRGCERAARRREGREALTRRRTRVTSCTSSRRMPRARMRWSGVIRRCRRAAPAGCAVPRSRVAAGRASPGPRWVRARDRRVGADRLLEGRGWPERSDRPRDGRAFDDRLDRREATRRGPRRMRLPGVPACRSAAARERGISAPHRPHCARCRRARSDGAAAARRTPPDRTRRRRDRAPRRPRAPRRAHAGACDLKLTPRCSSSRRAPGAPCGTCRSAPLLRVDAAGRRRRSRWTAERSAVAAARAAAAPADGARRSSRLGCRRVGWNAVEPIPIDDRIRRRCRRCRRLADGNAGRYPSPAEPQGSTWLTRFVILRMLGVVYVAASLSPALQVLPRRRPWPPAGRDLPRPRRGARRAARRASSVPTVWLDASDRVLSSARGRGSPCRSRSRSASPTRW